MRVLSQYGKSRIETPEMQRYLEIDDYIEFAKTVKTLEEKGILQAVKSSNMNGKNPVLFNRYTIIKEKKDYSFYQDELGYKLNYELNTDYYRKNPERYLQDRKYVHQLSDFLNNRKELLLQPASINERSFQIWGREKYLKEKGRTILNRLGFAEEKLNYYQTTEPLAYFSNTKDVPQNIILIENKDTFYTMRRYLIHMKAPLLGKSIGTLIYGAGKGINKSFRDFELSLEPYHLDHRNQLLYLGDLDYEGIGIYERLYETCRGTVTISPFIEGYQYMVDKALNQNLDLPETKGGQNKNIKTVFLDFFTVEYREKILSILKADKYIPQEIISYSDLSLGGTDEA